MFGIARLQRSILFPRHLVRAPAQPPHVLGLERWWLSTEQGEVEACVLPGQGVSAERSGPVVLFAHGNGELIDYSPARWSPIAGSASA